jgi:hypothetical protein
MSLLLEFDDREMTVQEMYLAEDGEGRQAATSMLQFVGLRCTNVAYDKLLPLLFMRPASELRALFNQALSLARPATDAAMKRIDSEDTGEPLDADLIG